MKAKIVRIGNSRGIRIPRKVLEEAGLEDMVDLEVTKGRLVVRPLRRPRAHWEEAFEQMAARGDDALLLSSAATAWDEQEWEW